MGDVVITVTSDTTSAQKNWRDLGTSMTAAMSQSQSALNGSSSAMISSMGAATRTAREQVEAARNLFSQLDTDGVTARQLRDPFRGAGNAFGENARAAKEWSGNTRVAFSNASFAVQDFVGVLQMGGKNSLGRAAMSVSNNIGVMGAGFGPWGIAIAGATAVLLPFAVQLFETSDGAEAAAASLKKTEDAAKAASDRWKEFQESDSNFRTSLKRADSSSSAKSLKESLQDESSKLEREVRQKQQEVRDMDAQWMHRSGIDQAARPSDESGAMQDLRHMEGKLSRLQREAQTAAAKERKLLAKESSDEVDRELNEQHEQREAEKDRLAADATQRAKAREDSARSQFLSTRTRSEKFSVDAFNLKRQFDRGDIDSETFGRSLKMMRDGAMSGIGSFSPSTAAVQRGSREDIEAEIRSANAQENQTKTLGSKLDKVIERITAGNTEAKEFYKSFKTADLN